MRVVVVVWRTHSLDRELMWRLSQRFLRATCLSFLASHNAICRVGAHQSSAAQAWPLREDYIALATEVEGL